MKWFYQHIYIFYSFIFLLNIIYTFRQSEMLHFLIGVLALIMMGLSFPRAGRVFKILGIVLTAAGVFFFISGPMTIGEVPGLFAGNVSLLLLLSMLPWMNSAVKAGRYNKLLKELLEAKVHTLGGLYGRSEATMVSLAAFLNLSSATISQDLLKEQLKKVDTGIRNSFVAMATLRGYSLALLWSPLEILLATSIFITGADYLEVLPWMILIALLGFAIDTLIGRLLFKKVEVPERAGPGATSTGRRLKSFILALVLFLSTVVFLANVIQFDFLFSVTVAIFPFAFLWSLLRKRHKSFWKIGVPTWKHHTNHLDNFIVLLLSLSFLTGALNASPYLELLQEPIIAYSDSPLVIMLLIQSGFLLMTLLGVHPLATMGIFGGVGGLLMEALPSVTLAVLLSSTAIATVPSAPYGLIVTITSVNFGMNPYKIVWKNLPFTLVCGALGVGVSLITLLLY
ncbi:hypothetical protein U0355_12580 [Salimicrobium sp. PL1-032A]|uniref:hypothetical protein n=1 Tax=Salimicrobium sp. PL1-032A TaxID=3095364 RepID=UPI003261200C